MTRPPRFVLLAAVVMLLSAVALAAGEPTLQVRLDPPRLGVEDVGRLTITVRNGSVQQPPTLGPLSNLEVTGGPFTERSFSWVNGVATSATSFTWMIQPLAEGRAEVGAVTAQVDDQTLTSDPISLEIAAGSIAPPRRMRSMPASPLEDLLGRRGPQREARVALNLLSDRREVVAGEPLVVTVVLDTTADVDGFEWTTPPSFPGWWAQRVDLPDRPTGEVVEHDGMRFRRFPVARFVLIPLKPGKLALPPASARVGLRSLGVFAPPRVLERATSTLEVTVHPRPRAPAGFAGAVGELRYSAHLEPSHVRFGESLVLTIKLEGKGNLPLVEAPSRWPSCTGCETYPPEEDSNVKATAAGLSGSRVWRMTVLPRQAGTLRFAPVDLAVFDPMGGGHYLRQTLGPLEAVVEPPPTTPAPEPTPAAPAAARPAGASAPVASPAGGAPRPGGVPWWWAVAALLGGVAGGGVVTWLVRGRRGQVIPRMRQGQSPADRARELQAVLERWWLGVADGNGKEGLRTEMEGLRRDLEAVRFAPARADHSDTVEDLEGRLRALMRRA